MYHHGIYGAIRIIKRSLEDGMCELRGVGLGEHKTSLVFEPLTLTEVSRGKTVMSSKAYRSQFRATAAIDDSNETFYSNDGQSLQPWWVLDLEAQPIIHTVVVLPVYHHTGRFNDIGVFVGSSLPNDSNFTTWQMLGHYTGPYTESEGHVSFTCTSDITGQYVAFQRISATSQKLEMKDVKIYVKVP
ncbi:uncharacterized protein LOC122242558 [Penaeus japonicus]|uniref:uncharacterized protein LOC122242558 n=1 Tax=Penaeus japonicus TaxID=27405 RepID=UPI001C70F2D6|nr:uncharacterized protein LOC122242558 [Penaeus japonicus]